MIEAYNVIAVMAGLEPISAAPRVLPYLQECPVCGVPFWDAEEELAHGKAHVASAILELDKPHNEETCTSSYCRKHYVEED